MREKFPDIVPEQGFSAADDQERHPHVPEIIDEMKSFRGCQFTAGIPVGSGIEITVPAGEVAP
jgi:hypothetical protein